MTRWLALILAVLLLEPSVGHADDSDEPAAASEAVAFPKHRYTLVAGGILVLGGLGAGYIAQGDAARAQSVSSATDTRGAIQDARFASATANLLLILATVTLAYGVLLEFLPPDITEKGALTFHF